MSNNHQPLPPLKDEQHDEFSRNAVNAANRAAKKLREQKRLLGHKLVIYKNGEVVTVDP